MHRLLAAVILMFLSLPVVAAAPKADDNELLSACTDFLSEGDSYSFESGRCVGTITGIIGMYENFVSFKNAEDYYCAYETATVGQFASVIVMYLGALDSRHSAQ